MKRKSKAAISADEFRVHARQAFAFLQDLGFVETLTPTATPTNPWAVWFASPSTRILVEGINFGLNSRVAMGSAQGERFENYDLDDLINVRRQAAGDTSERSSRPAGQLVQLPYYSALLQQVGEDVLRGDHTVFPSLAARVEARRAEFAAGQPPKTEA